MDLLYLHILNIPEHESLSGVYVVDGVTLYASTKLENKEIYKLYTVINYRLSEFLESTSLLGHLDTVVAEKYFPVTQQNGRWEDNIRVVTYLTDRLKNKNIKKPTTERNEISRFTCDPRHRLF